MDVSEAIRQRRSIRKYAQGVEIPEEHVQRMLEAAMMAPSACNSRPWEYIIIASQQAKEAAADVLPYAQHLRTASLGVAVCAHPELLTGMPQPFWPQDCAAATENLMLEALALGYGTCWCGVYPDEVRVRDLQNALEITGVPVAVITIGVPAESPAARGYFDPDRVQFR